MEFIPNNQSTGYFVSVKPFQKAYADNLFILNQVKKSPVIFFSPVCYPSCQLIRGTRGCIEKGIGSEKTSRFIGKPPEIEVKQRR